MSRKNKPYSLNQRIMLMIVVPPLFLMLVLLLYLNLYRTNVETMAETTFRSMAEIKQQQLKENLDEIRGITKEIAYSSMLQQYLTETKASEKVRTYQHYQNYLRAISANADSIISAYASTGAGFNVHMADGYLFSFVQAQKQLELHHPLYRNTEYFTPWRKIVYSLSDHLYGMYYYVGSSLQTLGPDQNTSVIGAVMYDPSKLLPVDTADQDHLAILMMDDVPVFLCGKLEQEQVEQLKHSQSFLTKINGVEYYFAQYTMLQEPTMKLLYLVPRNSLIQHSNFWENQTLMIIVMAVVLLALTVILILSAIFKPIRQMCNEVDRIKTYGEHLSTPRAKELAVLAQTYNAMSERVGNSIEQEKQLIDQQYQLQIQKNRMEMQAFRNQINPHFLFNTLECVNGMVRYYRVEPLTKLISSLSSCFHYTLHSPMMVTLEEEIKHLTNYLEIIETRFPGKYRIIHRVDAEAKGILVPSLLLQPLAENAVTHAFRKHTKKARPTIVLQAQLDEAKEHLTIHIIDNGMGMDDEKLAEVLATAHTTDYVKKHISLNNVYRRLTLLYGADCMQIASRSGCYTRITARIPLTLPAAVPLNSEE